MKEIPALSHTPEPISRAGLGYGIAAYGLWGIMPLYFRAITGVQPLELLAHRIVWSVLFLGAIITWLGRWGELGRCLANPRTCLMLLASSVLIACNWFLFIYGVYIGKVVQNSLGYFINPLINILLGVIIFSERLHRIQWLALGLATVGLCYLIVMRGEVPWLAFGLASSFALYGLLRKTAPVEALVGLTAETLLLCPFALALMIWWLGRDDAGFGHLGATVDVLLLASGVVTAVPLWCFGQSARRLPLSMVGFLQYLAPTIQFLLAVLLFDEPFRPVQQVSFGLIWSALVLVSVDLARRSRQMPVIQER